MFYPTGSRDSRNSRVLAYSQRAHDAFAYKMKYESWHTGICKFAASCRGRSGAIEVVSRIAKKTICGVSLSRNIRIVRIVLKML